MYFATNSSNTRAVFFFFFCFCFLISRSHHNIRTNFQAHDVTSAEIIFNAFSSPYVSRQAFASLKKTTVNESTSSSLFLIDLEKIPPVSAPKQFANSIHLNFGRRLQRLDEKGSLKSSSAAILLPPMNLLTNPDTMKSRHSPHGILFSETHTRALFDNVGRCASIPWRKRSPKYGAFCGTKFYPLQKLAEVIKDEMGGPFPPSGRISTKKSFLFGFGSGASLNARARTRSTFSTSAAESSNAGALSRIPADWCDDLSPCLNKHSANENSEDDDHVDDVEENEHAESEKWNLQKDGFPLAKVKFAGILKSNWYQKFSPHAHYPVTFAAAGVAPIIFNDEILISGENDNDKKKNSLTPVLDFLDSLLLEPWSSYIPVRFNHFEENSNKVKLGFEVFDFSKILESMLLSSNDHHQHHHLDSVVENVATNHRNLIRSVRFNSPIQNAYLASILVASFL